MTMLIDSPAARASASDAGHGCNPLPPNPEREQAFLDVTKEILRDPASTVEAKAWAIIHDAKRRSRAASAHAEHAGHDPLHGAVIHAWQTLGIMQSRDVSEMAIVVGLAKELYRRLACA